MCGYSVFNIYTLRWTATAINAGETLLWETHPDDGITATDTTKVFKVENNQQTSLKIGSKLQFRNGTAGLTVGDLKKPAVMALAPVQPEQPEQPE